MLPKPHYKANILLFLILWFPLVLLSQPIVIGNQELKDVIPLQSFFTAVEDAGSTFTPAQLSRQSDRFSSLLDFKLKEPDNTFWLRTNLKTTADLKQNHINITFNHLTFVDLYLYQKGKPTLHKVAGAFRKRQFIADDDNRFSFHLELEPNTNYILLLKVRHTKKYPPNFDFVLQSTLNYIKDNRALDMTNFWLQGAITILLVYALICWIITRYRPYLWVLLFLLGVGLYSFALTPAFIDIFFPHHPEMGWLLVPPFLHLGIIGFYLLMIDFLEMQKNAPSLYKYGHYLVKGLIIFSVLCVLHNRLTSNYYLTNQYNLYLSIIHLFFVSYALITLRKKLDAAQRYLLHGTLLFGLGVIIITLSSFLFKEQSFVFAPIITKSIITCITMLFLAGLNQKLRQHEQEKIQALQELNSFQRQQTALIEQKVTERTLELRKSNLKLTEQQVLLLEKKQHIETLMDELNHRVKNNLQMLYSLNTLQLPLLADKKSKQIINEMRGRIKAMMLVNEHLHVYKDDQSVMLSDFIHDIAFHIQQIYDREKQIEIRSSIPQGLPANALVALPFGLILTELFTNAYKHAFTADHDQPIIALNLFTMEQKLVFIFEDNGIGTTQLVKDNSMGLTLIQDLVRQLKGIVDIRHHHGFSYRFTFSNTKSA